MRCLYCGKELALFKRLTGGEFCSDTHRRKYQEDYTELALHRLLDSTSTQHSRSSSSKQVVISETPAERPPAEPVAIRASSPAPRADPPRAGLTQLRLNVAAVRLEQMAAAATNGDVVFSTVPRFGPVQVSPPSSTGRVRAARFLGAEPSAADSQFRARGRATELRTSFRPAPLAGFRLTLAGARVPGSPKKPVPMRFDPFPASFPARVSHEHDRAFPPREPAFAEAVTLDYSHSEWDLLLASDEIVPEPIVPISAPAAGRDTAEPDPALFWSVRPEPAQLDWSPTRALPFEPVRIEPVFIEHLGTSEPAAPPAESPVEPASGAPEARQVPASEIPPPIARPVPVTLHGIAPARGKVLHVFSTGLPPQAEWKVPREAALPLRPVMLLDLPQTATAPAPANKRGRAPKSRKPQDVLALNLNPTSGKVAAAGPAHRQPNSPAAQFPAAPNFPRLPTLLAQPPQSLWSRLPAAAWIGIVALGLAAITGGVFLTSSGSGAPGASGSEAAEAIDWIAASTALPSSGWTTGWFADPNPPARRVDLLQRPQTLRDFRMEFDAQIDRQAFGWVFRANNRKSFYVEKIRLMKIGAQLSAALVRFAVIDGKEQPRTETPFVVKPAAGPVYRVRLDAFQNRFVTWVQNQKVADWTDDRLGSGGVGVYYDDGDSAEVKGAISIVPLKRK